ncbi:MAG: hypothetical protein ABIJ26_07730 [Candidatus Margulisiibacteriota bacterium]|uniref:Uncharacterized protein n=1 Tax=viral metagenome TaxID=1070528 RepID=A0A6H1Z9V3_9ZZZZ
MDLEKLLSNFKAEVAHYEARRAFYEEEISKLQEKLDQLTRPDWGVYLWFLRNYLM